MPLRSIRRKDRASVLTIEGSIKLKDGSSVRIRRRAASDNLALAEEERIALEAEILRTDWHGERRGSRSFDEALISYLESKPRHETTKRLLRRIREHLGGETLLSAIDQDRVNALRRKMLPHAAPASVTRHIITPLRAVLRHAHRHRWCDAPMFEAPPAPQGRTLFMLPAETDRLVEAAAPHLRPLIVFLICTGARLSEAIYLDWQDVDIVGARAIFWDTKNGKRRIAELPHRTVLTLSSLEGSGPVFLTNTGKPYAYRGGEHGGQIKTAFRAAIRRAGLNPGITPHVCRHTWASCHYALHRDLIKLRDEGGWSSVALVERYAHLMPAGHEAAIRQFFGHQADTDIERNPLRL